MDQDLLTLAVLFVVLVAALTFPGGPGTPRRHLIPIPIPRN
jgi:hypothetical protein